MKIHVSALLVTSDPFTEPVVTRALGRHSFSLREKESLSIITPSSCLIEWGRVV